MGFILYINSLFTNVGWCGSASGQKLKVCVAHLHFPILSAYLCNYVYKLF